jgi:putative colanic acid biosynthesis acetyltransferase WcaF
MIDVVANRAARKWTRKELALRLLWDIAWPLFAYSPRQFWAWRRLLLRCFGAKIGRQVHVYPSVAITIPWNITIGDLSAVGDRAILYALGPITIGREATISQGAHLCAGTHDYTQPEMPLIKSPIFVGDGAWICADAFIAPGVEVGAMAIVGARAVAIQTVAPGTIVVGNPAKRVKMRSSAGLLR